MLLLGVLPARDLAPGQDRPMPRPAKGRGSVIALDVVRKPVWCGRRGLIVSGGKVGLRWIDVVTRRTVVLGSQGDPVGCSPDGQWIAFLDHESSRWELGGETRGVKDFWRHHLSSGRRERFAVAYDHGSVEPGRWSPDGQRFLIPDSQPRDRVQSGPPVWTLVWAPRPSPTDGHLEAAWMADSASFLILLRNRLWLARLGGSVQELQGKVGDSMSLRVDALNRLYVISRGNNTSGKGKLLRCELRDLAVACAPVVDRSGDIVAYDLTPRGDRIVFHERESDCAWLMRSPKDEPECAVSPAETSALSSDGRWLAVFRERMEERREVLPGVYVIGRVDAILVDLAAR